MAMSRFSGSSDTVAVPRAAAHAQGEPQVQGAQSARRALLLLKLVAKHRDEGVRLAQLVRESELDRGTAYRLLSCLVEEQFVDRGSGGLYYLGPESVLLGSLLGRPASLLNRFLPALTRIARISGDTTFLMMRQGDYVCCVHREEGSSQVKVLTTHIGQRRMIGTGTGGQAVMEFISPAEIAEMYHNHEAEYIEQGMSLDQLLDMAQEARERGYGLTHDAFGEIGIAGIGVAFRIGAQGIGAISVATLTARLGTERLRSMVELLNSEIRQLSLRD